MWCTCISKKARDPSHNALNNGYTGFLEHVLRGKGPEGTRCRRRGRGQSKQLIGRGLLSLKIEPAGLMASL